MSLPTWRLPVLVLLSVVLLASSVADAYLFQRPTPPVPATNTGRRSATIVMAQTAPRSTRTTEGDSNSIGKLIPASLRLLLPRLLLPLLLGGAAPLLQIAPALAAAATTAATMTTTTTTTVAPVAMTAKEPTEAQLQAVRDAFKAFDGKDLAKAERLFDRSVKVCCPLVLNGSMPHPHVCEEVPLSLWQSIRLVSSINPIDIRHGRTSVGRATSWGPCSKPGAMCAVT